MNHLQHESSPYLRQHAANPVDWHPWGAEALERARRENKPILVSIGYSTCHWCHVMERESFVDPTVATIMNDYFINIKVDREERPDLDQLYMEACQVLTGQGGWPLNVFLTPELRPFFAGTYFPPVSGLRRQSWLQALEYAAYNFYENREAVERQADRVLRVLEEAEGKMVAPLTESGKSEEDPFRPEQAGRVFAGLQEKYDAQQGGFEREPKFPNTMALEFLLHYAWHSGEPEARDMALFSLDRMLAGGIYDQIGGGLCRYSTDREWHVPHFEKMLYDNALLGQLLADAYRLTQREDYREALEQTLAFVDRELTRPEGGFYAALDADSEGQEGRFYTWTPREVQAALGEEDGLVMAYYDITKGGNWEGKSIPRRKQSLVTFAAERGLPVETVKAKLADAREKLLRHRNERPRPHRDEKILLSWNALMVTAYGRAALALGRSDYQETAVAQLDFLLSVFRQGDGPALLHSYAGGKARFAAYLNDYAFLIEALLEGYALTFSEKYLTEAERLTAYVLENFYDPADRLFFFAGGRSADLILRRKEVYDAEMPSGNAAMVRNLQRLGLLFDRRDWREQAADTLYAMLQTVTTEALPFANWATALLGEIYGLPEIAVVGPQAPEVARTVQADFLPAHVLMAARTATDDFPLLQGRPAGAETLIYLCRDYACRRPVTEVEELRAMLEA